MENSFKLIIPFAIGIMAFAPTLTHAQQKKSGEQAVYRGNPASAISASVTVPAGKQYFFSSGTVAQLADSTAAPGTPGRYGNTETQAHSILEKLKADLGKEGLTFGDVIFMRVYVAPDPATGKPDFKAWFNAYGKHFGTDSNPVKPARSTIGVAQLVNPDLLIEIEIVAVY